MGTRKALGQEERRGVSSSRKPATSGCYLQSTDRGLSLSTTYEYDDAPMADEEADAEAGQPHADAEADLRHVDAEADQPPAVVAVTWAEIKTKCEEQEPGGHAAISLDHTFEAGPYPGEIDFSNKSCAVDGGAPPKTLDAGSAGRFFTGAGSFAHLELSGLILKGGSNCSGGGAILAVGVGARVEIHSSEFLGNQAHCNTTSNSMGYGGAINCKDGANLTIFASEFRGNSALRNGGAIYFHRGGYQFGDGVGLEVHASTFANNNAPNGGALFVVSGKIFVRFHKLLQNFNHQGSYAVVDIVHSAFKVNSASNNGGALLSDNCQVNFGGMTVFAGNFAGAGGPDIWQGGSDIEFTVRAKNPNPYSSNSCSPP